MLKLTEREFEWVKRYGVLGHNLRDISRDYGVPYEAICWHFQKFLEGSNCRDHLEFKRWVRANIANLRANCQRSIYIRPKKKRIPSIWSSWTPQARECYALKQDCSRCSLPPIMGDSPGFVCQVPKAITELLKNKGAPE